MQLPVKNMAGQQVGAIELSDAVFAAPVNSSLMHQALVRQLANARQGTHKTKERGEVEGGGKKPWRQKGTGRARQGSTRAPNFIGGGTIFGPRPRKYTQALPKKMQRAALRSALSVKADAGQIVILDSVSTDQYKTKVMSGMLKALGLSDQRVLMVLNEKNAQVWRSVANLPKLTTLLSGYVNVRDLLGHDVVVLSNDAAKHIELWLGNGLESTELDESATADDQN
jgi:large subunit ribosomal protein L4